MLSLLLIFECTAMSFGLLMLSKFAPLCATFVVFLCCLDCSVGEVALDALLLADDRVTRFVGGSVIDAASVAFWRFRGILVMRLQTLYPMCNFGCSATA